MDIKERANQASLILNNPIIEEMWEALEKSWDISGAHYHPSGM